MIPMACNKNRFNESNVPTAIICFSSLVLIAKARSGLNAASVRGERNRPSS
jgi:hypothetical protein